MPTEQGPLAITKFVLRLLILANFVYAAAIVAGLIASFVAKVPFMTALGLPPSLETEPHIQAMRAIALIGLGTIPLHFVLLTRLLAIVGVVEGGDPFVTENAERLRVIAWALLGVQVVNLVISVIAQRASTREYPLEMDAGFSIGGWLAVVLLFVLAHVFREGSRLRADLQGTV